MDTAIYLGVMAVFFAVLSVGAEVNKQDVRTGLYLLVAMVNWLCSITLVIIHLWGD